MSGEAKGHDPGSRLPFTDDERMAPIAAWLYAAAGLIALAALLLPQSETENRIPLAIAASSGFVFAALIYLMRNHLPRWFFHISTAGGTLLTGFCVIFSGGSNSPYVWLLLWVAAFSAYFFTFRQTVAHLVFAGAVFGVALEIHEGPDDGAVHVFFAIAALIIASLMIGRLVSERRSLERDRERLLAVALEEARTDPLTGLLNRRAWIDGLDRELARASRSGEPVSIAMLDLDHFKEYNDAHGHPAGDRVLIEASAAWMRVLRPTDQIARHGGEEFTVAMPGTDLDHAAEIVERLRAATPQGQRCSAGVTRWDGRETASGLVARADVLLYEAKAQGRDRTVALV
ncbi:GGDEF domain-containing protein [Thermoleophilia bacterium SCSIO 60948]|nr:GGDEF domain-containing protein [Thermoleophilia bacterium SCSIO 60948]